MKDKVMYLIIGILIGAIITTTGFLIYNKIIAKNSNSSEMIQMGGDNQMQPPAKGNMEEPPAKPEGDNSEEAPAKPDGEQSEEPPAKPEDSNNSINS